MMPNLGQGGCQAMEDAFVIAQELQGASLRSEISSKLESYRNRRLVRSAAVQGLSRFASDIIIRGFDTPAKIYFDPNGGGLKFENLNYAGIVTKLLQPILPIFFNVQFNFLYEGWRNEVAIDINAAIGFLVFGGLILLLGGGALGEAGGVGLFGLDALLGGEGMEAIMANLQDFF
jgi:zeaxanthin epoxidase